MANLSDKVTPSGVLTPTGNGSGLTSLTSGNLTGALPAISGAALTGLPAGTVTGIVAYFAATAAPTGFIKANGATLSRTTYADLFAVVGETFGAGDGSTTFLIPDLRGEFMRGVDDGRGIDASRVFGSAQTDAIQNITGAFGRIRVQLNNQFTASGAFQGAVGQISGDNGSGGAHTVDFTFDASRSVRTSTETRSRNVALLACIKF